MLVALQMTMLESEAARLRAAFDFERFLAPEN